MIGCIHVFTPQAPGKNLHHSNEIKVEIVPTPPGDTFLRVTLQKPRVTYFSLVHFDSDFEMSSTSSALSLNVPKRPRITKRSNWLGELHTFNVISQRLLFGTRSRGRTPRHWNPPVQATGIAPPRVLPLVPPPPSMLAPPPPPGGEGGEGAGADAGLDGATPPAVSRAYTCLVGGEAGGA